MRSNWCREQPATSTCGSTCRSATEQVLAVHRHLVQVVLNLLSNAVKYGGRGSTVRVRSAAADGRVPCSVADQGPGIAARPSTPCVPALRTPRQREGDRRGRAGPGHQRSAHAGDERHPHGDQPSGRRRNVHHRPSTRRRPPRASGHRPDNAASAPQATGWCSTWRTSRSMPRWWRASSRCCPGDGCRWSPPLPVESLLPRRCDRR